MSQLFGKIERIGGFELHAIGKLERLDACFQLRVIPPRVLMFGVELGKEVELAALRQPRKAPVYDVFDEFLGLGFLAVDMSALINAGQESGAPVRDIGNR